jgi:protein-tyrosine phosphatase
MAEALMRRALLNLGVDCTVSSAGLRYDGRPASENGVEVLSRQALDISGHRSRIMTSEMLLRADLLIGMERMHVREAVVLEPDVFPRTFTLKELVRRAENTGPRIDEPLDRFLERLSAGRSTAELLGDSLADDVEDPIGGPLRAYATAAAEIADLVDRAVDMLWGHALDRQAAS